MTHQNNGGDNNPILCRDFILYFACSYVFPKLVMKTIICICNRMVFNCVAGGIFATQGSHKRNVFSGLTLMDEIQTIFKKILCYIVTKDGISTLLISDIDNY